MTVSMSEQVAFRYLPGMSLPDTSQGTYVNTWKISIRGDVSQPAAARHRQCSRGEEPAFAGSQGQSEVKMMLRDAWLEALCTGDDTPL